MKIRIGQKAPNFELKDQYNKAHSLERYLGRWIVLYFYPKDDTPGCTKEACSFRDDFLDFEKIDAVVLGVSVDSTESHKKFAEKYGLSFPLLADSEKKVVKLYGVWGIKKISGRQYLGTHRTTFIVNPKGKIAKIYNNVKPENHAKQILSAFEELR